MGRGFESVQLGREREFADRVEAHYEWRFPDYGFSAGVAMKPNGSASLELANRRTRRLPGWKPTVRLRALVLREWPQDVPPDLVRRVLAEEGIREGLEADSETIHARMMSARGREEITARFGWTLERIGEAGSVDEARLVIATPHIRYF